MRRALAIGIALAVFGLPSDAAAQADGLDVFKAQEKAARVAAASRAAGADPDNLLAPGRSTRTRTYFRVEVHQGGIYEPSIRPAESWLEIACISDDLQTPYSRSKHGFGLVRVHALVYDRNLDKIYDTIETEESDEGICSVSSTLDTTFVELPRISVGRKAAAVALIFAPRSTQYIEASKIVYRILPR